ncbi:MAG: TIGR00159 family protein [Bacteroidetes bacterium]|nr:TIGR00159 family protein [Bacteroidota bacterium]
MDPLIALVLIHFRWQDAVDIILVAFLLYQLYRLVRGTAAMNILIGVAVFYTIYRIVGMLGLELFSSVLEKFIDVGAIALLIVFQQELRRFFLYIGSSNFLRNRKFSSSIFRWGDESKLASTDIGAIVKACRNMAESKTGALIVITRNNDLRFYSDTGDPVEARVSVRMIESIFYKNSPLHDGAIIITNNMIIAARCVLPVTENNDFPAHLGMRHRAAAGISENADAIAIAVSEQTGDIAFSKDGEIQTGITADKLKEMLEKGLN